MRRVLAGIPLVLLLSACEQPLAPPPLPPACGSGNVIMHANSNCSLGTVVVYWPSADDIYNPTRDCQTQGNGPQCPTQQELKLNPDPLGPNTILVVSQPNRFNLNCRGNCRMTIRISRKRALSQARSRRKILWGGRHGE